MLKKSIKLAYDRTMKDITPNRSLRRSVVPLHRLRQQHQICRIFVRCVQTGDRLCGLVVRVSGYRYRGPGFDPRRYQIF